MFKLTIEFEESPQRKPEPVCIKGIKTVEQASMLGLHKVANACMSGVPFKASISYRCFMGVEPGGRKRRYLHRELWTAEPFDRSDPTKGFDHQCHENLVPIGINYKVLPPPGGRYRVQIRNGRVVMG